MISRMLLMNQVFREAGFVYTPFKNEFEYKWIPANQQSINKITRAVLDILDDVLNTQQPIHLILSGMGPIWAFMVICDLLENKITKLSYTVSNSEIEIFNHSIPQPEEEIYLLVKEINNLKFGESNPPKFQK